MDTFTIILNIIIGIFFILSIIGVLYSCKSESDDFMHDYFGVPKEYDFPDELTIEIVKETPAETSVSQSEPSVQPLSVSEQKSLCHGACPKQKAGYVPE